jgi:hypothetical protein
MFNHNMRESETKALNIEDLDMDTVKDMLRYPISRSVSGIPNNLIRIRILHFRLNTDPDPFRIQGFDDQKLEKKNYSRVGSKTTIYSTYSYASKIYIRSLQLKRKHPALQNIKFLNFFNFCRSFFCPHGSGYGYGSNDLIKSGSNPDPDPKHWL